MENYGAAAAKSTQRQSNSASSADSTVFNSSGTDSSASLPTLKSIFSPAKIEGGRFTRTKIRALKMYGDLKKVKEPISPGGRIANFLNSIFSLRNLKMNQGAEDWGSVRKSRSMKDYTITTSCLSRNPNSSRSNKSKRSIRFCPISEGDGINYSLNASMQKIGCNFISKNIDSFRFQEVKNARSRKFCENEGEFDDKSCCSSDLFELENIGAYDEELPVYGTTDLKMN